MDTLTHKGACTYIGLNQGLLFLPYHRPCRAIYRSYAPWPLIKRLVWFFCLLLRRFFGF